MTNNLESRVHQHKNGEFSGFTAKYQVDGLVYYEETDDVRVAYQREKQIKGWRRSKKIKLIEAMNPEWDDLSETWYT
jgi:putative endonuclease